MRKPFILVEKDEINVRLEHEYTKNIDQKYILPKSLL